MSRRDSHLAPGEVVNYDWENDHAFVKASAADTGAAYTLTKKIEREYRARAGA